MTVGTRRTVVLTERVPAPSIPTAGRRALGGLVLAHLLLVAAVLADGPELVLVVVLLLCAGAELATGPRAAFGSWALARAGLGAVARMGIRSVAVLVAMSTAGLGADRVARVLVLLGLVAVPLALVAVTGLGDLARRARQVPVSSRGLVPAVEIPPASAAWTSRVTGWPLDVVVSGTAVWTVGLVGPAAEIVVLSFAIIVALAPPLLAMRTLVAGVRRARRLGSDRMTTAIEDALEVVRPELALYFAGPADALYQLTMWLPTFERLASGSSGSPGRRSVVVLRDPEALLAMPPTSLPVVCAERGNTLLQLQFPTSLLLACYVGNAAGNIHFLRERTLRHVFIGHGDSDKTVSTGRYAKVYDEIWAAGPAGRARWQAADVGVDDDAVVEVGAPFVEPSTGILAASRSDSAQGRPAIAYAPTWEGVADGADTTSVGPCGEALVRRLLELDVRVIYRPHPLTGTRDPRTAAAHARILRLLGLSEPSRTVRRAAEHGRPVDALDVATMTDGGTAQATTARARDRAATLLSGSGHVYAPAASLPLDAALGAADAAVTDISAALSVLVALGIPMAVTNPAGLPATALRHRYPTTANAYLIGPDGTGVDPLVAAARGEDPLAQARVRARELLFGSPDPQSERFVAAVENALRRARRHTG